MVANRASTLTQVQVKLACDGPYELTLNDEMISSGAQADGEAISATLKTGTNVFNVFALKLEQGTAAITVEATGSSFTAESWKVADADTEDATLAALDDLAWPLATQTGDDPQLGPIVGEPGQAVVLRRTLLWEKTRIWPTPNPAFYMARGSAQHINVITDGLSGKKLEGWTTYIATPLDFEVIGSSGFYGTTVADQPKFICTQLGTQQVNGSEMRVAKVTADKPVLSGRHYLMSLFEAFVRYREEAGEPASTETEFIYWSEANGGNVSEPPQSFNVRLLPELDAQQPNTLVFQLWGGSLGSMDDLVMREEILKCTQAAGFNDIVDGARWTSDTGHKYGLQLTMSINFQSWSINLAPYLIAHPDERLITSTNTTSASLMCMTLLLGGSWSAVEQALKERLDAICPDTIDYDYEYGPYAGPHSCYCSRCLDAFREFATLDPEVALDPQIIKDEYGDQWIDFMAHRVAQMFVKFKEATHRLAPGTKLSVYSGYQTPDNPETYGINWQYIGDLQACDRAGAGYGALEADIYRTIDALQGIPLLTGLIVYPYDTALTNSLTPLTRAGVLRMLLAGSGGVLAYARMSFDGRVWHAVADVSRLAAAFEDVFLTGTPAALAGYAITQAQVISEGRTTLICAMNLGATPVEYAIELPADAGAGEEFYSEEAVTAGEQVTCSLEPGDAAVYVMQLSAAAIGLSPGRLTYTGTYGGSNPSAQSFIVTNLGAWRFDFTNVTTYSAGATGWWTSTPATGRVNGLTAVAITGSVSLTGINAGTYYATNAIVSADATNSPQYLVATLTVNKATHAITNFTPAGGSAFATTSTVGLAAQASPGLTVTNFTVISGPGVINTLTNLIFTNSGSVSVEAAGDNNWNAAPNLTHTFTVTKVLATMTLSNTNQLYNGTARMVTIATDPAGLQVDITYNGHAWAPINRGTYAVTCTVNDPKYQGSTNGTLIISELPAPTGLTASSGTYTNRVALSWTGSLGAVTYEIWRSIYPNVGLAYLLGTVPATVTTYEDTTGDALRLYYYFVRSRLSDAGAYSDFASGYRNALLKPSNISASKGTFNSKIRVLWQAVDAATKYEIWRSTDTNLSNAVRIGTVTIQGYDDTQASVSQFYYYWIKAHNAQGFASPYSEMDVGWLQLATPANVAATQGTRPYSVRISWNAVENATSYEVVRRSSLRLDALAQSLAESTPPATVAPAFIAGIFSDRELTQTFFDDNATFAGASYLYRVRAKNALGNSELSGEAIGWRQVLQATTTKQVANDYDGDKLADVVLFNPGYGLWRILCSTLGEFPVSLGDATCVPVQGDYDGDGLTDPMIYSADQSYWWVMLSSAGYTPPIQAAFGGPGQLAAAADYDGDRLTDPATYQAATGMLRVLFSESGYVPAQMPLGGPGYVGSCADYDGDGKADPAVYSATDGLLRVKLSTAEYCEALVPLGGAGMIVVPVDFDGDGKSELTTYNEATGTLAIQLSSAEYWQVNVALGGPGYAWVVPSDYDGDGMLDPAAYSQTDGWMIMFSSLEYATVSDTFGGTNNVPFVP
ncbi:MAG: hypothetical protein KJ964_14025 [Verrucomicrobia bacterium]|nr:hypothetical protein [Verrucomicrobiota bacterium]MBU1734758.1 hypothetical protein [Verrucomicrobiota bacterium]MBU1857777.1 hypothetical protein [Verrucomicrobiota bacterium]